MFEFLKDEGHPKKRAVGLLAEDKNLCPAEELVCTLSTMSRFFGYRGYEMILLLIVALRSYFVYRRTVALAVVKQCAVLDAIGLPFKSRKHVRHFMSVQV